jgi:tetratricopeptide (TPR) repeat protein
MVTLRTLFFSSALLLGLLPVCAYAQTAAPTANDQLAREHFVRGRDAFSQGDFAVAAREFDQAYQLSRRPQLLYNIGSAYERLHNWNEANIALHRYLELVPDAPDRAEVEARLRIIEMELEHASHPPEVTTNTRVVVVERQVTVPVESRPWRTAFFVSGGLTVIGGGLTLAVGLLADARYRDLTRGCGAPNASGCSDFDLSDMRVRQSAINGGIVVTSVFAAATVTFFVLDRMRPTRSPTGPLAPPVRAAFFPLNGGGFAAIEGSF